LGYDFVIECKKGRENRVVDAFSCNFNEQLDEANFYFPPLIPYIIMGHRIEGLLFVGLRYQCFVACHTAVPTHSHEIFLTTGLDLEKEYNLYSVVAKTKTFLPTNKRLTYQHGTKKTQKR
jgi:hypothetical protein